MEKSFIETMNLDFALAAWRRLLRARFSEWKCRSLGYSDPFSPLGRIYIP